MKITIPGELCDLNTYINAERRNRFIAAKIKKEQTEIVQHLTKGLKLTNKAIFPLKLTSVWFTKNLRKDADNLTFAKKFILDGFVASGLLPDDSRKFVRVWCDEDILVDKNNPRVEITIHEI